jgi:hypothetical protein
MRLGALPGLGWVGKITSGGRIGVLPSEGKGHKFESCRARHDLNDLAELAQERLIAAEAPRKHSTGGNRTVLALAGERRSAAH